MLRMIHAFHVARLCKRARAIGYGLHYHAGGCRGVVALVAATVAVVVVTTFYVARLEPLVAAWRGSAPPGRYARGRLLLLLWRLSTWHAWSHLPASP